MQFHAPCRAVVLSLVILTLCGRATAVSVGAATVVAPARVSFLDTHGHRIVRTRAHETIQFVLQFAMPASFPAGFTDLRFTIFAHGRAQRTVIYGTPKRLLPGRTLRVSVLVPVPPAWIGSARVVGAVALFSKPNGVDLHHAGRGTATLTVTR